MKSGGRNSRRAAAISTTNSLSSMQFPFQVRIHIYKELRGSNWAGWDVQDVPLDGWVDVLPKPAPCWLGLSTARQRWVSPFTFVYTSIAN